MLIPILISTLAVASARPSYIALPADQIAFIDLTKAHIRVPRQTLTPPPLYDGDYMPIAIEGVQNYQQNYQPIPQYQQPIQQQLNLVPIATPSQALQQEPQESSPGATQNDRPPDFGEYVDFGAHTGDNGAFGWYADYPISHGHAHHESGFR